MPHGFERIDAQTHRPDPAADTVALSARFDGWRDLTVRVLHPYTWDAKHRGYRLDELTITADSPRTLVSGAYSVADAAVLNHDERHGTRTPFGFPESGKHDNVVYLTAGHPPEIDERYQDAAGWCTITGVDESGSAVALATALDRSDCLLLDLMVSEQPDNAALEVRLRLPWQTFAASSLHELPGLWVRSGPGGHSEAEAWLRELLSAAVPSRASTAPPPLIADTWGFGEDIDAARVAAFFDTARDLGVEIVTVDKGWEERVGDWVARPSYAGGIAGVAHLAHERGMRLGLWVGAGNAHPDSIVAREHPDWLATWNGRTQLVSFGNHSLCLGHEPAREHVLACLDRLVRDGVDWLLHDFETISRCDAAHHTHDPGAGEAAGVTGWYTILATLRERHPQLLIENCWNGGKPLDLQVIAHHDTTIGDDLCQSGTNRIAAVGLGTYLPSSWTSKYMSDEHALPLRVQLAPYVIGGPWILMGNLPAWSAEQLATVGQGADIYRRWRTGDHAIRAIEPVVVGATEAVRAGVRGLAYTPRADGSQLATFAIDEAAVGAHVAWVPSAIDAATDAATSWLVRDEWAGTEHVVDAATLRAGVTLDTARVDGIALSVRPVGVA